MDNLVRLDRVSIFGGKLSLLIPHEWVEGESDPEECLYESPEPAFGWFRISLITSQVSTTDPSQKLSEIFKAKGTSTIDEQTGNRVSTSEKETEENGVRIHLYYWMVASVVPPDLIREAVFSYTVLSKDKTREEIREMVKLIGQLVSRAEFYRNT